MTNHFTVQIKDPYNFMPTIGEGEDYQASVYPESRFSVQDLSGLEGIWDSLFGKPQSWYDRLNSIQNQLAILQAGISAIGQEMWDTIADQVAQSGATKFDGYSTTMDRLGSDSTGVLITSSHVPSDAEIQSAQIALQWWNPQLAYARNMVPELEAKVQADMAQSQAMVSASSLKSPATVGVETFEAELQKRAEALGQGAFDFMKYLAWGIGGVAAIYVTSQIVGGRRAA
jgi:hypothetical protein